jgi:adenylate cyclase, class 2
VDDERVPGGALLGVEDLLDCGGGEGVGAETVDRLGGEGYGVAGAQEIGGAGYALIVNLQSFGGRVHREFFRLPGFLTACIAFSLHRTSGDRILFCMQSAEIELKFPISNLALLQVRLPGLGFRLETPRTFEQNTLYDTPGRTLRESNQLLRIRRYGPLWTMTHKRRPDGGGLGEMVGQGGAARYKVRIETETHVDDGAALAAIFEQLGYAPVFRYEKFRTEWAQGGGDLDGEGRVDALLSGEDAARATSRHLVIDETPIGDYAELEGPPEWIDETIARLGVDPATCITDSYGRLFLTWKQKTGSLCENLTFDEVQVAGTLEPSLR